MTIIELFKTCLKELENNSNIELNNSSLVEYHIDDFNDDKEFIASTSAITLSKKDIDCFHLSSISLNWESQLILETNQLKGGFAFNGITDALCFPSTFWKGAVSLPPDVSIPNDLKHYEKLGWFVKLPDGLGADFICFIKQPGQFPPPIVLFFGYSNGRYVDFDFGYFEYLRLMFQNYGFKGWYYFYIDIPLDLKNIDDILNDMKTAVLTLPKLFPDNDWTYHKNRFNAILEKLERLNKN